MLAPGSKDVKVETDENTIVPEWVEAVPLGVKQGVKYVGLKYVGLKQG